MTFQYIINHLHEPHLWCIVLTGQRNNLRDFIFKHII